MWHTPHSFQWPFTSPVHEDIVLSEVINEHTHAHTRAQVHTQVHTHAHVLCGRSNLRTIRSNLQTSDSGHAGHMPLLQRAQWQTPVRSAAVPDVDISAFVLTPDAAELFIPLLSSLHSSSALSCTPLRLSLSLDLSACCLIRYEGAISLEKPAELCLWSAHAAHVCFMTCRLCVYGFMLALLGQMRNIHYEYLLFAELDRSYTRPGSKSALTITSWSDYIYIFFSLKVLATVMLNAWSTILTESVLCIKRWPQLCLKHIVMKLSCWEIEFGQMTLFGTERK